MHTVDGQNPASTVRFQDMSSFLKLQAFDCQNSGWQPFLIPFEKPLTRVVYCFDVLTC